MMDHELRVFQDMDDPWKTMQLLPQRHKVRKSWMYLYLRSDCSWLKDVDDMDNEYDDMLEKHSHM